MATGGSINGDSEEWERTKNARNIQELFKGRMTPDEAAKLLRHFEWDRGRTVNYILEAGPGKLAQLLNTLNKDNARNNIEDRISGVKKNDVLRDLARRNEISASVRQFACGDCDNMWWRRVPNRKPVSRCKKCRRKFDALDPGDEWGWAQFDCECGNVFKGTGHMRRTKSMCFHCGVMCEPSMILPPLKKEDREERRTRNRHSCAGENCFNRKGRGTQGQMCLHPKSLPCVVQCCSQPHTSTGSTVLTFLDQSDIQPAYEPSLCGIPEVGDEVAD